MPRGVRSDFGRFEGRLGDVEVEGIHPASHEGRSRRARIVEPLEWVYRRGWIEWKDYAAGAWYRRDWEIGGFAGVSCGGYEPRPDGVREAGVSELVCGARERFMAARRRLGVLVGFADAMILEGKGLQEIERREGWAKGCGLHTLRLVLRQLQER